MSWDAADKKAKDMGGKYIKLAADEDNFKGVLMGPPTCEDVIFDKKLNKHRPFTQEDEDAGRSATSKFKFNVFTLEVNDDELEKPDMKIVTFNATTYRFISKKRQSKKYKGDLGFHPITVTRNGEKGSTDTTYNVSVSDAEISSELQEIAKKLKLHDLENDGGGDDAGDSGDSGGGGFDSYDASKKEDGPLSTDQKNQLCSPYKPGQPLADELAGFLTKFGVQAFKDLKASQFDKAMAYSKELLKAKEGGDEGGEAGGDPFS